METHKIIINGDETIIETPVGFGQLLIDAYCAKANYANTILVKNDDGEMVEQEGRGCRCHRGGGCRRRR